jgi:hypothetical protein
MKSIFKYQIYVLRNKFFFGLTILITLVMLQPIAFAHTSVSRQKLSKQCQKVVSREFAKIKKHQPTSKHVKNTSFDVSKDYKGNYSIGFSALSGEFGSGELEEQMIRISQRIAPKCPQVALISFSGPTWSNWTMRRDNFTRRHHKYDDRFPGDVDFYWNWNKLPFNYDPLKNYFPN